MTIQIYLRLYRLYYCLKH